MWKKITIAERKFLIRTTVNENMYGIMLSDFSKVWIESLTKEQLLKRCKEINPLIEAEPNTLIERIFELINSEQDGIKQELLEVGNQLTITFSSFLKGFIFKFKFILVISTSEKFCESLTVPLVQIIEELQARQKMLCDLLVKKDAEINEYKMEGAQITRKNVITTPFDEETFFENCYNNGEERSLNNLRCPFSFFEKSCAEMYEECTKRKKVTEIVLTPKKDNIVEKPKDPEIIVKPETSRQRREKGIMYVDEVDEDETYFSIHTAEVKPTIKTEMKTTVEKKKKRFNL